MTAIPSAMVSAELTGTGFPAASDPTTGAHPATCTPITSIAGRADLSAIATPLTSPPPPTGTITRARSGTCSSSSSPSVPCPAITSGSSNGWTNAIAGSCAASSCAASSASSTVAPTIRTSAPSAFAASTLEIGAGSGMNTTQRTPRDRAAYATAWAWFPALPVTTPPPHASPSAASLDSAPRSLNEPVRCRFSALNATVAPARSLSVRELSTGVSFTTPAPACAARRRSNNSVSSRERHHRVDLDQGAARQSRHGDRHPRRRIGFEE